MAQGDETLLTAADDGFHPGPDPWQTEGSWWSFFDAERRIGGWIYHLTRLNLGVASGGVWVWDERTRNCFEAPYFRNEVIQPLAAGPRDLNDWTWPDGVHLRTLDPLQRYRLRYTDRDRIALDFEYRGVAPHYVSVAGTPPRPFRLEQLCRVTGSLSLRGESIPIDCLAFRDHSWGVRPEQVAASAAPLPVDAASLEQRPVVYLFGHASAGEGFFVMSAHGYLARADRRADLKTVSQRIDRDPGDGHVVRIVVAGTDTEGRSFEARGETRSRILRPSNSGVALVHLVEWSIGAQTGWGELQDVWPYDLWATYRRSAVAPRVRG